MTGAGWGWEARRPFSPLGQGRSQGPGGEEELPRAADGGGRRGCGGFLLVLRTETGKRNRAARARGKE